MGAETPSTLEQDYNNMVSDIIDIDDELDKVRSKNSKIDDGDALRAIFDMKGINMSPNAGPHIDLSGGIDITDLGDNNNIFREAMHNNTDAVRKNQSTTEIQDYSYYQKLNNELIVKEYMSPQQISNGNKGTKAKDIADLMTTSTDDLMTTYTSGDRQIIPSLRLNNKAQIDIRENLNDFMNYYTNEKNTDFVTFLHPNKIASNHYNLPPNDLTIAKTLSKKFYPNPDDVNERYDWDLNQLINEATPVKKVTLADIKISVEKYMTPDQINNLLPLGRLLTLSNDIKGQIDGLNDQINNFQTQINNSTSTNKDYRIDKYNILQTEHNKLLVQYNDILNNNPSANTKYTIIEPFNDPNSQNNGFYSSYNNTQVDPYYTATVQNNQNTYSEPLRQDNRFDFNQDAFSEPPMINQDGVCIINEDNIKDYDAAISELENYNGKIQNLKLTNFDNFPSGKFNDLLDAAQSVKSLKVLDMSNTKIDGYITPTNLPDLRNFRLIPPQLEDIYLPAPDHAYNTFRPSDGTVKYKERKERLMKNENTSNINTKNAQTIQENINNGTITESQVDDMGGLKFDLTDNTVKYTVGNHEYTVNLGEFTDEEFNELIESIIAVKQSMAEKNEDIQNTYNRVQKRQRIISNLSGIPTTKLLNPIEKGPKSSFHDYKLSGVQDFIHGIAMGVISINHLYDSPQFQNIGPQTRTGKFIRALFG